LEGLASGDLEDLDWVFIRGADGSLMEGAKPASEAIRILEGWHYAIKASDRETDSTRPQLIMGRDYQIIQMKELRVALEAAVKAKDEQAKLANERQATLEELKKQLADAKGALEAAVKARDENANALKSQTSEINQLKTSSSDRASRIADLESQVADQAERQREIDEQMVRAEAQLEMLKEFMRPSLE
jgi:chromosome segregation ATPase